MEWILDLVPREGEIWDVFSVESFAFVICAFHAVSRYVRPLYIDSL